MVISGENVCCDVVFGTLVGVYVFSVMWSELMLSSVVISERVPESEVCIYISGEDCVWYICDCYMQCCMSVSAVL